MALAREEWQAAMKEVFKNPVFKERREKYDRYCKEIAAKEKEREREEARAMREAARLQVRMEKSLAQEARKRERENLKAIRDEEKRGEAAEKAAKKEKKAALAAQRQKMMKQRRKTQKARAAPSPMSDEASMPDDEEFIPVIPQAPSRPRPRPIPKQKSSLTTPTNPSQPMLPQSGCPIQDESQVHLQQAAPNAPSSEDPEEFGSREIPPDELCRSSRVRRAKYRA